MVSADAALNNNRQNLSLPKVKISQSDQYTTYLIDLIKNNNYLKSSSQFGNLIYNGYSKTYQKFHPVLKAYSDKFGYIDVALIDPKSGCTVYSSNNEPYFCRSIKTDPISKTHFAKAIERVKSQGYAKRVAQTEFGDTRTLELYFASSVIENNSLVGIIIFRFPFEKYKDVIRMNQLLTATGTDNINYSLTN